MPANLSPILTDDEGMVAPADGAHTTKRQVARYTGPGAYDDTTGDVIDPNDVRMGKIFAVLVGVAAEPGGTNYLVWFDPNGPALWWIVASSGLPVANGVDLSNAYAIVEVIGQ